jgi:hypothetical protein
LLQILPVARSNASTDAAGFKVANGGRPSSVTARLFSRSCTESPHTAARQATWGSVLRTRWRGELTPHSCRSRGSPLSSRNGVSRDTGIRSAHDSARLRHRDAVPLTPTWRLVVARRDSSPCRAVRWQSRSVSRRENRPGGSHGPSYAVKIGQLALTGGPLERTGGQSPRKCVSWQ